MRAALLALLLAACWGDNAYIVEGTVLEVAADGKVVVDHGEIPGLMGPMVMAFDVAPGQPTLRRGDRIVARLHVEEPGTVLRKVRVTGYQTLPEPEVKGPEPLRPGQALPAVEIAVPGGTWTIGAGQPGPTVVTFLYTTCPLPEFCPLTLTRLQALQPRLPDGTRLLAVTVDPAKDTIDALAAYAKLAGADPARWQFGRLEKAQLDALAMQAGLGVFEQQGQLLHAIRWLVLDREGRLIERYDDNALPLDRVVEQLATGGPPAPAGIDGTLTPEPTP